MSHQPIASLATAGSRVRPRGLQMSTMNLASPDCRSTREPLQETERRRVPANKLRALPRPAAAGAGEGRQEQTDLLTGRRGPPRLPGPGHDPGTVARHTGLYRHGGWVSYYKRDRARNRVISTVP